MEDSELKSIWQKYDQQLEDAKILNLQSWVVNIQTIELLQKNKSDRRLNALSNFKISAVVLGIIWAFFLVVLIYFTGSKNIYFTISAGMILLFTLLACVVYIWHVVMIRRINLTESVVDAQQKLQTLQSSTINIVRILVLQTPFYSTWFWHPKWVIFHSTSFWLIAFPITLFLTILSLWLFKNISINNANKKWFRVLFSGREYRSISDAKEYLDKIEDFKKGSVKY